MSAEHAIIPECSVCLTSFADTDPVTVLCGHTFCKQCLLAIKQRNPHTATCPTCRQKSIPNTLKVNIDLRDLAKALQQGILSAAKAPANVSGGGASGVAGGSGASGLSIHDDGRAPKVAKESYRVFQELWAQEGSAAKCTAGLDKLSRLIKEDDEHVPQELASFGAVILILSIMKRHQADAAVQRASSAALANFAYADRESAKRLAEGGAALLVLSSLRKHQKNDRVAFASLSALRSIAFASEKLRHDICEAEAVPLIAVTMETHGERGDIQEQGIAVLCNLALDQGCVPLIMQATPVVLQGMRLHADHRGVQEKSTAYCYNLILHLPREQHSLFQDAPALVAQAMLRHDTDSAAQTLRCRFLANVLESPKYAAALVQAGAVVAGINVLEHHMTDCHTVQSVCRLLRRLTFFRDDAIGVMSERKGVAHLLHAARLHERNAGVQEWVCATLRSLSYSNVPNQTRIMELGGLNIILNAMRIHATVPRVQEQASAVLCNLCTQSANHRTAVATSNAVVLICGTLQRHEDSPGVCEKALGCLSYLAMHEPTGLAMMRPDLAGTAVGPRDCVVLKTTVHILRGQPRLGVAVQGLALLARMVVLARDAPEEVGGVTRLMDHGIIEVVVKTLSAHGNPLASEERGRSKSPKSKLARALPKIARSRSRSKSPHHMAQVVEDVRGIVPLRNNAFDILAGLSDVSEEGKNQIFAHFGRHSPKGKRGRLFVREREPVNSLDAHLHAAAAENHPSAVRLLSQVEGGGGGASSKSTD